VKNVLILGIDSDIGRTLSDHFLKKGYQVLGSTRQSRTLKKNPSGLEEFHLDFESEESVLSGFQFLSNKNCVWEMVIVAIGILEPLGPLSLIPGKTLRKNFQVNLLSPVLIVQELLRNSLVPNGGLVVSFAGSGTNSAPKNYFAYSLSKVALIKAMELFSVEYPECGFISLGTGWIKTKIHSQTLSAGPIMGEAYFETLRRLEEDDFGNLQDLTSFFDWIETAPRDLVTGRNFSLQGDDWAATNFLQKLKSDPNNHKLRRGMIKP